MLWLLVAYLYLTGAIATASLAVADDASISSRPRMIVGTVLWPLLWTGGIISIVLDLALRRRPSPNHEGK